MDRLYIRNYLVVVAGMFCWLNASVVSAQTVGWFDLDPSFQQALIGQRDKLEALLDEVAALTGEVTAQANEIGALSDEIAALQALHPELGNVVADPSAFPGGTDVSNAYPGVTLSTAEGSVGVIDTTVSSPLQLISNSTGPVFTTGSAFSHTSGDIWSAGCCGDEVLRADFVDGASFVSMQFLPTDTDTGFLQAYDADGVLLSDQLARSGAPFTLAFTATGTPIAYILATFGDTGRLGTLTFR